MRSIILAAVVATVIASAFAVQAEPAGERFNAAKFFADREQNTGE